MDKESSDKSSAILQLLGILLILGILVYFAWLTIDSKAKADEFCKDEGYDYGREKWGCYDCYKVRTETWCRGSDCKEIGISVPRSFCYEPE